MGTDDKNKERLTNDRGDQERNKQLIDVAFAMRDPENWPALSVPDYRALWKDIPRPTATQIQDFASFVGGAHSWYKHLPMYPPGGPFCFFLDPMAGMDYVVCADKQYDVVERPENGRGLHYSWMPTSVYRRRFGFLSYSTPCGSRVFMDVSRRVEGGEPVPGLRGENPDGTGPIICLRSVGFRRLPTEVINEGTVWITGVVHELADGLLYWQRSFQMQLEEVSDFDSVVDGMEEPYRAVAKLCRKVDRKEMALDDAMKQLPEILRPEREFLLNEMRAAIERVVALCYSA